jgi:hypothetical protein
MYSSEYSGEVFKMIVKYAFIMSRPLLRFSQLKSVCPDYDEAIDTPTCPAPSGPVESMPTNIRLMGVSFGRQPDSQPQGNPDKNPLLNIYNIAGVTVPVLGSSSYRPGYIIAKNGITVGLTNANMTRFAARTAKLAQPPTTPLDSRD